MVTQQLMDGATDTDDMPSEMPSRSRLSGGSRKGSTGLSNYLENWLRDDEPLVFGRAISNVFFRWSDEKKEPGRDAVLWDVNGVQKEMVDDVKAEWAFLIGRDKEWFPYSSQYVAHRFVAFRKMNDVTKQVVRKELDQI